MTADYFAPPGEPDEGAEGFAGAEEADPVELAGLSAGLDSFFSPPPLSLLAAFL